MVISTSEIYLFRQVLTQAVRVHWVLFLIEGIVLVMLGVLGILMPVFATISVVIFIGWLILISGVVGLVTTFTARDAPGFWWSLGSAVLGVVTGIVLLDEQILDDVSLTLLLVVFLNIEGVAWITYALIHRKELSGPWTWMLVGGIVDLILAFIILCQFPGTAAWALSLLVGTSMLFGGTSMIAMAVHARSSPSTKKVA